MTAINDYFNNWTTDNLSLVKEVRNAIESSKDIPHTIRQLYIVSRHNKTKMFFLSFVVDNKYPEYKPILEKLMILE
jgi:hypothetical protein